MTVHMRNEPQKLLEVHAHLGLLQWLSLVKCCVFQQTIPALRALVSAAPRAPCAAAQQAGPRRTAAGC